MAKKNCNCPPPGAPGWMTSFADLQQLLLVFFILLFSFSTMDVQKFKNVATSLQGSLGVLDSGIIIKMKDEEAVTSINARETEMRNRIRNLYEEVKDIIDNSENSGELKESIEVVPFEEGVVLRVKDSVFFDSGKAIIKPKSKKILSELSKLLGSLNKKIIVEGHTDNIPVSSGIYPTNWELSSIRAASVVRYLLDNSDIQPETISAVGYGEYHPVESNATEYGRARNRRVDIKIIVKKGDDEYGGK